MNYYQILGISRNATQDEIKKAYRRLAHQYHPDKNGGDEEQFKKVNEAYQVLGDPQKRRQYDQFGRVFSGAGQRRGYGQSGFGTGGAGFHWEDFGFDDFGGFGDIFSDIFSGFGVSSRAARKRGEDISINIELNLVEAIRGKTLNKSLRKYILCERCGGAGAEPGSDFKTCSECQGSGQVRRVRRTFLGQFQQISSCRQCQGVGELPEKKCSKCGGEGRYEDIVVETLEIPAGMTSGQILRFSGRGHQGAHRAPAGDLLVNVNIRRPRKLSRKAAQLLDELEREL